jgi:hypothetical protein
MLTAYALNTFAHVATLKALGADGKAVPLTVGPVGAFLALTDAPTAAAAAPELDVTPTHVGNGRWLVVFEPDALTVARVGLFPEVDGVRIGYLIIASPTGRVAAPVQFELTKPAEVVA